jgi:hypothetical protein
MPATGFRSRRRQADDPRIYSWPRPHPWPAICALAQKLPVSFRRDAGLIGLILAYSASGVAGASWLGASAESSIHLGWHFAIDGYAGALGAALIWWATGQVLYR